MCASYSSWQWTPEADDSLSTFSGNLSLLILRPEDQQKGEHNLKKKGIKTKCVCYNLHSNIAIIEISNCITMCSFFSCVNYISTSNDS